MPRLRLSSSKVVAEIIDGEAIILDLRGGSYFATDGVGAIAWTAATQGWSTEHIIASASTFYPNQPDAGRAVSDLLDGFVDAKLLEVTEGISDLTPADIEWPQDYEAPVLEKHDDLQGMMQLDPIHDTDVSGWPMPSPSLG